MEENHIIEIELDKRKYYKFRDPIYLCDYVENIIKDKRDEKYYLFIYEVQFTKKVKDKESEIEKMFLHRLVKLIEKHRLGKLN